MNMIFNATANFVRLAVGTLGGPTQAAITIGTSGTTIHNWIKKGRIPSLRIAEKVSKLTKISVQKLRGQK